MEPNGTRSSWGGARDGRTDLPKESRPGRAEGEHPAQAGQLEGLRAGEATNRHALSDDPGTWYLGVIATGLEAEDFLRRLAGELDRELHLGEGGEATGWLSSHRPFDAVELREISAVALHRDGLLVVGEPGEGLAGRSATRRQAWAAYGIAVLAPRPFTRYRDVALLAAVVEDPDLAAFLEQAFLAPLCVPAHRGRGLPATIRAYLDAGGDVSRAASALGLDRQSVAARIDLIQILLGGPPRDFLAELDLSLRLRELLPSAETAREGAPPLP